MIGKQAVEVAVLFAPLVAELGGDAFDVPVAFPEGEAGGVDFVLAFAGQSGWRVRVGSYLGSGVGTRMR